MKKFLLVMLLAVAVSAAAQTTPDPQAQGQPQEGQQKKEIKDPGEFNAYMEPLQSQDPQQKIMGLEAFLGRYPQSVVREDAMEALMGAYQQTGNWQKTLEIAQQIVRQFPKNLGASALLAYNARQQAAAAQDPAQAKQHAASARELGTRGLQSLETAVQPEGVSAPDWEKRKQQLGTIFHEAAGAGALAQEDFEVAQQHLRQAVQNNPNDFLDNYQLALAYLSAAAKRRQAAKQGGGAQGDQEDPQAVQGLWFMARAVNLAPAQSRPGVEKFGQQHYRAYTNKTDGWSELLAQAKTQPMPPAGFTVKVFSAADAAAEMAVGDVSKLSIAEWEFILSNGRPETVEKAWAQIKGKPVAPFAAKVISAQKDTLELAATVDAINENRANVIIKMTGVIPANLMPKVGADQAVRGTPVSYDVNPFVITMDDGVLIATQRQAPARRTPPRRNR